MLLRALFLLSCLSLFHAITCFRSSPFPASLQASLSSDAFTFMSNYITPIIEKELQNMPLPDEHLKGPLGIRVDLTSILVDSVSFSSPSFSLQAPAQLLVDDSNVQGHISLNWHYKGLLIKFGGTMDITFASTSISSAFSFSSTSSGRPSISMPSLGVKIDDLNIRVHGGGSGIWNFLIKLIKPFIIHSVEKAIDSKMSAKLNAMLSDFCTKYPLSIPLHNKLNGTQLITELIPTLSLSAQSTPAPFAVNSSCLIVGLDASVSLLNGSSIASSASALPQLPPVGPDGKLPMLAISFDDFLINSLLWSMNELELFHFHLENKKFTTSLLKLFFSDLYSTFPGAPLQFLVDTWQASPPYVHMEPSGMIVELTLAMQMNVINDSQVFPVTLFQANMSFSSDFQLTSDNSTLLLQGALSPLTFNYLVLESNYDTSVLPADFSALLQGVVNDVLDPIVNGILKKGISIPMNTSLGVELSNTNIVYENQAWSIGMDLKNVAMDAADNYDVDADFDDNDAVELSIEEREEVVVVPKQQTHNIPIQQHDAVVVSHE